MVRVEWKDGRKSEHIREGAVGDVEKVVCDHTVLRVVEVDAVMEK